MKKYKKGFSLVLVIIIGIMGFFSMFGINTDNNKKQLSKDPIVRFAKNFESDYSAKFLFRDYFININYYISLLLNKKDFTANNVYKADGNFLFSYDENRVIEEKKDEKFYKDSISQLQYINEDLSKNNIDFLYVLAPSRSVIDMNAFGIKDYSIDNHNSFVQELNSNNIPYLNIAEFLTMEKNDWFYKTDHHWTAESGFSAALQSVEKLNDLYGYNFDSSKLDASNFELVNYKKSFLGSIGVKVSKKYKKENFSIYIPKTDTDFTYTVHTKYSSNVYNGKFSDAFLNINTLNNKNYLNKYSSLLYDISYYGEIKNNLTNSDKKLLLISDSFGRNYAPYLSFYFSEIKYIDPQQGRYTENVKECIEEFQPTTVIYLCNGQSLYHALNY